MVMGEDGLIVFGIMWGAIALTTTIFVIFKYLSEKGKGK